VGGGVRVAGAAAGTAAVAVPMFPAAPGCLLGVNSSLRSRFVGHFFRRKARRTTSFDDDSSQVHQRGYSNSRYSGNSRYSRCGGWGTRTANAAIKSPVDPTAS
jgi:hypothetical protein